MSRTDLSSAPGTVGRIPKDNPIRVCQAVPGVVVGGAPDHDAMGLSPAMRVRVHGSSFVAAVHHAIQAEVQVREVARQGVHPPSPTFVLRLV